MLRKRPTCCSCRGVSDGFIGNNSLVPWRLKLIRSEAQIPIQCDRCRSRGLTSCGRPYIGTQAVAACP